MKEQSLVKSDFKTLIYEIRGFKVMLDHDLAALYEVETKRLKESVRRNMARFPKDFMFELNKQEFEILRSQNASSSWGGTRYMPMAFTEQGVAMLSSVLSSDKAIQINIEIMRAFANYRALILQTKDLDQEIKKLDKKMDEIFKYLLLKIDALRGEQLDESRTRIGYKQ